MTTAAPGPYAALPLARALDRRFVPDDDGGLAAALRAALDGPADDYAERALALLEPYRHAAVVTSAHPSASASSWAMP